MPATKEELKVYNRYEVVVVSPKVKVVGIYQTLKEAEDHKSKLSCRPQDLPVVIYDRIKQERV